MQSSITTPKICLSTVRYARCTSQGTERTVATSILYFPLVTVSCIANLIQSFQGHVDIALKLLQIHANFHQRTIYGASARATWLSSCNSRRTVASDQRTECDVGKPRDDPTSCLEPLKGAAEPPRKIKRVRISKNVPYSSFSCFTMWR